MEDVYGGRVEVDKFGKLLSMTIFIIRKDN